MNFREITIDEIGRRLRARRFSAVELANETLSEIRAAQPRINAFITVTDDLALAQARLADEELGSGIDRGPLHGIPYALKDLFHVAGYPTTGASRIFHGRISDRDSAVYLKLRDAGAVLVGKTNLHELAYGVTNDNPHFGAVRNPADPSRISGGSSGGSAAAVAAGLVPFAMGTDTGGSIRIPASYCGCVGFKPTFNVVETDGVMPLAYSLDHVGPLTKTAQDAALVMQSLTGNPFPHVDFDWTGIRVGVPENFYCDRITQEVAQAFESAVEQARSKGVRVVKVRAPNPEAVNTIGRIILLAEASALYESYRERRNDFGADVLALLDQGRLLGATDYINAQRLRHTALLEWKTLFSEIDFLFTPTTPITAPLIGTREIEWQDRKEDVRLATSRLTRAFNVLGLPAVSLPLKTTLLLPAGLQIVGSASSDAILLRAAAALF